MKYRSYHKFIIRRPLFNYSSSGVSDELLNNVVFAPEFREALYYASPEFYVELHKYLKNKNENRNIPSSKKNEKLIGTVYKYLSRMLYRCTPFGAFSYCGVGNYGECTKIASVDNNVLSYSFDGHLLFEILKYIRKNIKLENIKNLILKANPSICKIGDAIYLWAKSGTGESTLKMVETNELLVWVLSICDKGINVNELVETIFESYDISKSEIYKYIESLEINGLLVNNYSLECGGNDVLNVVIDPLDSVPDGFVGSLNDSLKNLSSCESFEEKLNILDKLKSELKQNKIPFKDNRILQVNGFLNEKTLIDKSALALLEEWFEIILNNTTSIQNPLNNFINRFKERYEEQTMPLLEVLNPISGIGYTISRGEDFPIIKSIKKKRLTKKQTINGLNVHLSEVERVVFYKLLKEDTLSKCREIVLKTNDITRKKRKEPNVDRLSISCMYKIVGFDEKGPIISHINFSGTTSAYMLTRFALENEEIKAIVDDISTIEQNAQNKLLAEISHVTNPHSWNVQKRPNIRKAKICINSYRDDCHGEIIDIKDLSICIKNDKVKLISNIDGKEVFPCFTSAYNYKYNSSEIYRFLGDVQMQYANQNLNINFNGLLKLLKHIPRIRYKNIIVAPESWLIEVKSIISKDSIRTEDFYKLLGLKDKPQFLSYAEGDQAFIVDVHSAFSLKEFSKLIRDKESIILEEFLPQTKDFKHYDSVAEIIQPFIPYKS